MRILYAFLSVTPKSYLGGAVLGRVHLAGTAMVASCDGAAKRPHLERLHGHAPDLNPDEGIWNYLIWNYLIWNYLKQVELKNRYCTDLAELAIKLRRAKEHVRHKRHFICKRSTQCGYSV